MGIADELVLDDAQKIAAIVRSHVEAGLPIVHRSQQVDLFRERIRALDTSRQIDPLTLRETWGGKTTSSKTTGSKTRKGVAR
jgi:malonate decarboxylase beta subunit